jgi:hypothetical protein
MNMAKETDNTRSSGEMDRTLKESRLYRDERIKSLFQMERDLAEHVEQALNEEERACDPSDDDKLAVIAFKRRRARALSPRLRDMIYRIGREPEKFITADGLSLDLDFYQDGRPPVEAWWKAYSQWSDVERAKQESEFWKELARDAICAAREAGVDVSPLLTAYPFQMAELEADANKPPF